MMPESEPQPWPREDIERLLDLLPILEAPEFVPATWPKLDNKDGVVQMPYPVYHETVEQLRERVWAGPKFDPYEALPEDTPETDPRKPNFETATVNQIRRYLMLCCRDERFCDGHIESQFLSGSIISALRKLGALQWQKK